ncbi:MAG: hypothetical protein ACOZAA_01490 [Pseudomonadota bacterium]
MAQRETVDLLVIGADAAGLAAAACAARRGASTALAASGTELAEDGAVPEPPNFVWRLLDFHQYDLAFEPVAARTSLFADTPPLSTFDDERETARALGLRSAPLEHLWPAFVDEMKRQARAKDGEREAGLAPSRHLSANAALDDYFSDEDLKAHLIAAHVAPFGLAGDEAGSVEALIGAGEHPRRRTAAGPLVDALKSAAASAGVDIAAGKLRSLAREGGKFWKAAMEDGREIRARRAMASSAFLGEAAGLRIAAGRAPLARRGGVEATIRIRYDRKPKLPPKEAAASYLAASGRAAIVRARNSMLEGRIDEDAPIAFEIRGKEIIARAPFCPARLEDNGELREWTGQDRQILGRQAAAIIERRLGTALGTVREIETTIGPDVRAGLKRRSFETPPIPAPAPSDDPVGAAAALALEIVGDE